VTITGKKKKHQALRYTEWRACYFVGSPTKYSEIRLRLVAVLPTAIRQAALQTLPFPFLEQNNL